VESGVEIEETMTRDWELQAIDVKRKVP